MFVFRHRGYAPVLNGASEAEDATAGVEQGNGSSSSSSSGGSSAEFVGSASSPVCPSPLHALSEAWASAASWWTGAVETSSSARAAPWPRRVTLALLLCAVVALWWRVSAQSGAAAGLSAAAAAAAACSSSPAAALCLQPGPSRRSEVASSPAAVTAPPPRRLPPPPPPPQPFTYAALPASSSLLQPEPAAELLSAKALRPLSPASDASGLELASDNSRAVYQAAYVLQHASCTAESASASFFSASRSAAELAAASRRFLLLSCRAAAVEQLEHGRHMDDQHELALLYAVQRAQLLSVATGRTLVLDRSGCETVLAMPAGEARDAALLCCHWNEYFQPVTSCLPGREGEAEHEGEGEGEGEGKRGDGERDDGRGDVLLASMAAAFSAERRVEYDVRQECLWDDAIWQRLDARFPAASRMDVVRGVTRLLLRPSSAFASHLNAMTALLPSTSVDSVPPVFLHIASLPAAQHSGNGSGSASHPHRVQRSQPQSVSISAALYQSWTVAPSALVVIASPEAVSETVSTLSHLAVTDLLSVVGDYWQENSEAMDELNSGQRAVISALMVACAVSREWVGTWSSVLVQLAVMGSAADAAVRLWDVNGDLWCSSCWTSAPHHFTAHHSAPPGYNIPSMTALLSSSPSSLPLTVESAPRNMLVLVVGAPQSGVAQLQDFLLSSSAVGLKPNPALSAAYSALFGATNHSVERYMERRAGFVKLLSSFAFASSDQRVLLVHTPPVAQRAERALLLYQHPSFLASVINELGLPLSLHVVVLSRQPSMMLQEMVRSVQPSDERLLVEGKVVRDVLSALEGELRAMDISVWRGFDYSKLWQSDVEKEGLRLARWLRVSGSEAEAAVVSDLTRWAKARRVQLFPKRRAWSVEEQDAVNDLFAATPSMQLFNPAHPAFAPSTYDYGATAVAALLTRESELKTETETETETALAEHVTALQSALARCEGRLLVFDGMTRWSSDTRAASQLLDLVRALTLALASGRLLVVPPVPDSITDYLLPVSRCDCSALGIGVERTGDTWSLHVRGGAGTDALSSERVVAGHSQVIDVAYLAAWNAAADSSRYVDVRQFVGTLLRLLLRPSSMLSLSAPLSHSAAVSIPASTKRPLSFYTRVLSAAIASFSLHSIRLSFALSAFQHVAAASLLPLVELPAEPADALGNALIASLSRQLLSLHPSLQLTVVRRSLDVREQLLELWQQAQGRLVIGSMETEEGFIVAATVSIGKYHDLFAYQFIPSLLALNAHRILHSTPPSSPSGAGSLPTAVAVAVNKTVVSDRCRFVFVAGIEGTGHHGVAFLLGSLRRYDEAAVSVTYAQVRVSDELSVASRVMFETDSQSLRRDSKRDVLGNMTSLLDLHCAGGRRRRSNGQTLVFVINTLNERKTWMQSYPNAIAADKTSFHPSLPTLLRICEQLQADCRALVITRMAGTSVASTALRRSFAVEYAADGAFYYQARALRSNLAALDSDVSAVSSAFVLKLALAQLQDEPELITAAIARHIGLQAESEELQQVGLRGREAVHSHPEDSWLLDMTASQAILSTDMMAIASHLPVTSDFRFAVNSVGGSDTEPRRSCRRRPMRLRRDSKSVAMISLEGGGQRYVVKLVEELSAVLTSRHQFDGALAPSASHHLQHWARAQLVAFTAFKTSIAAGSSLNISEWPAPNLAAHTVILHRNPLDVALTYALSLPTFRKLIAAHRISLQLEEIVDPKFRRWAERNWKKLARLVSGALTTVASAYVQWAAHWRVAERRAESVRSGKSADGAVVLRLEDVIASASSAERLRELLAVLELEASDTAVLDCVAAVSASVAHPPRLLSPLPAAAHARRTATNHYALNSSVAALQYALLSSTYLETSTCWLPFSLPKIISPLAFAAFRAAVDSTAIAIEGSDWTDYCSQVEALLDQSR